MRYWDSSAIVPLLVREEGSKAARTWLEEDREMVTWALTRVEIAGAIQRRTRQRLIPGPLSRELLRRLRALSETWNEVTDLSPVRERALSILARHALRSADAVQLAAAMVAAEGRPESLSFVCFDGSLAEAAEREGFPVLGQS